MEAHELPGRVEVEQLIHKGVRWSGRRKTPAHPFSDLAGRDRLRQPQVGERGLGLSQVRGAELLAALRAAILAGEGDQRLLRPDLEFGQSRRAGGRGARSGARSRALAATRGRGLATPFGATLCAGCAARLDGQHHGPPHHRLEDHAPAAARACAGVHILDGPPDRGTGQRRTGDGRGRGIYVAGGGRPEHHVREEPGQRPHLEVGRAALLGDRGPGHPAAAAVEVQHHLARFGPCLDRSHELRGGRGRGKPLEKGQRRNAVEHRLGVCGGAPDHAPIVTDAPPPENRVAGRCMGLRAGRHRGVSAPAGVGRPWWRAGPLLAECQPD